MSEAVREPIQLTKSEAKRLSLWANGLYIVSADHSGFSDGALTDDEAKMVEEAQTLIGLDMIRKSKIPIDATEKEALDIIANNAAERRSAAGRQQKG